MDGGRETVTTTIPEWVRPYAENFMSGSQRVANRPYQPYTGQTVAQLNPYTSAAYNAQAQRALQGSPVTNAAASEVTKTLGGGYLNANPYLDKTIDLASRDVLRNMTNLDARSGSFGNSGIQQNTASALGDIATQIRGADYANERGRQLQALGAAPSIANQDYIDASQLAEAGKGFQQQQQSNLTDQYQRFLEARQYPEKQLDILGKGLGVNYGSSTSGNTGPSPFSQIAGAGLGLAALGGK